MYTLNNFGPDPAKTYTHILYFSMWASRPTNSNKTTHIHKVKYKHTPSKEREISQHQDQFGSQPISRTVAKINSSSTFKASAGLGQHGEVMKKGQLFRSKCKCSLNKDPILLPLK